jgi:HlyD family secretion protein
LYAIEKRLKKKEFIMLKKSKKLKVILIIIVAVFIGVFVYGKFSQANVESTGPLVSATAVKSGAIEANIRTKGNVESSISQWIVSEVSAQIDEVYVSMGSTINVGDAILRFRSEDLDKRIRDAKLQLSLAELNYINALDQSANEAIIRNAKLNYENAMKSYEDTAALHNVGIVSTKEKEASKFAYDQAYNAYVDAQNNIGTKSNSEKVQALQVETARNSYNDLLEQKEKYTVRATMAGTVTEMNLKVFDMVTSGGQIAKVEDLEKLIVKTYIAEYDISKLTLGMPVKVSGYSAGDQTFDGKIDKIASSAGAQNSQSSERSVMVTIEIVEKAPFLPNFTADLSIRYARTEEALLVPYETLLQEGDDYFVLKITDKVISKIPVSLGIQSDIEVEIRSDLLNEGDLIVVNPTLELTDGLVVDLQEEE